ncbi:MAG: adenylyltransferase/cytidyltransferase family protein [Bacteroidales bacterium]|nr:adenylyltransferase/cytidyltransferase family protein [Bacteroidales bacterium]
MRIFRSFEEAAAIPSPVITTGTFDGVHIGHKTILRRLKSLAAMHGGESVLITFHPHPRAVLYPENLNGYLCMIVLGEENLKSLQ